MGRMAAPVKYNKPVATPSLTEKKALGLVKGLFFPPAETAPAARHAAQTGVNSGRAGGAAAEPANCSGWWKKPLVLEWNKKNSGYTGLFFANI